MFTKNKGQIKDQYNHKRNDIDVELVTGTGFNIFIGQGQMQYQWNRSTNNPKNPNEISEDDKGEYYVLISRERETGKVQFMNVSFFYAWLIEKINEEKKTLVNVLTDAEKIFGVEKEILTNNTLPFLEDLKQKQFILGFRK